MTALKRSSKLMIYDARRYLYCVYRGPGDWSNPHTISLIGTDGGTLEGVRRQVDEKFGLTTVPDEWSPTGLFEDVASREINTIWTLARPLDGLICSTACSRLRFARSCGRCRSSLTSRRNRPHVARQSKGQTPVSKPLMCLLRQ